eukprot:gene15944-24386_t
MAATAKVAEEAERLLKAGEVQEAIDLFDSALGAAGAGTGAGGLLLGKGQALLAAGRRAEAERCLARALEEAGTDGQRTFIRNLLLLSAQGAPVSTEHVALAASGDSLVSSPNCLNGGWSSGRLIVNEGIVTPVPEPCAAPSCSAGGLPAFAEEFTEFERAVVLHVSKHGAGAWDLYRGPGTASAADLRQIWELLRPAVDAALAVDPSMPCGHTCGTCPTRPACQLHGALADVEDIGAGP